MKAIPQSVRQQIALTPKRPERLSLQDQDEFIDSLLPEFQTEAEEVWKIWVERNEELAWAIALKSANEQKPRKCRKTPSQNPTLQSHSRDPMLEPKLSVVEAAKFLGIGRTRLQEIANDGEIPFMRMGGKNLFFERDLVGYIKARYVRLVKVEPSAQQSGTVPDHIRNSPLLKKGCKAA